MRNGSQISAQAFEFADGGNVTIDAANGFVVAVPDQNNDILANASQGQGGNINIAVQNIFGLEVRPRSEGPNDIDASSDFGLDGDVTIQTPGIEPDQGAVELSRDLSTPPLSQTCQGNGSGAVSQFFNIGRGGLTASPYDPLSPDGVQEDIYPAGQAPPPVVAAASASGFSVSPEPIIEARGWIVNDRGEVVLVAEVPDMSAQNVCYINSGREAI